MNHFIRLFLVLFFFQLPSWSAPVFTGKEKELKIRPTKTNYYLATLVEESKFYDPTFYDDYLLTIDDKKVLHFTKIHGEVRDYYFYVKDPDDLKFLRDFFKSNKSELEKISPELYSALIVFRSTFPKYTDAGITKRVAQIIREANHTTLHRVIGDSPYTRKIDLALYQYLWSNGVESLEEITTRPVLMNMITNKFFMLSTTYFFREWFYIKVFKDYLKPFSENPNALFKVKVFGCSTGEEVLSYAIDLVESGVKNFSILATDINDASLETAKNMQYSPQAFENLTLKTKEKFKKYFRLNSKINVYELIDPPFFKERIVYRNLNILSPLPSDLEERLAPPYHLISILNLLLYLENESVQKEKNNWLKWLSPNGILVLHDARYSLSSGIFNPKWSFDNFYMVNEWVNIKTEADWTPEKKVSLYQKAYVQDEMELPLKLYYQSLIFTGKLKESLELLQNHLQKHPLSFTALTLLTEYFISQNNTQSLEFKKTIQTLTQTYLQHMVALNKLIFSEENKSDKNFLKEIKFKYESFLNHYRNRYEKCLNLFSQYSCVSKKYEILKLLFQALAYSMVQENEIRLERSEKVEPISLKGFEMIEKLYQQAPEYIVTAKFMNTLLEGLVYHYIQDQKYEKALSFCEKGIKMYENKFRNIQYFYTVEGLGNLYYYRSLIYNKKAKTDLAKKDLDNAVFFLEKAYLLIDDLYLTRHSHFLSQIGSCYLERGKLAFSDKKTDQCQYDFRRSLFFLEKALEINPLYDKEAGLHREEVLQFLEKNQIQIN